MKKIVLLFFCLAALCLSGAEKSVYFNKALNPVKFSAPAKHSDIPLIVNGKINFVIAIDKKAETKRIKPEWKSITLSVKALQDALLMTVGQKAQVVDVNSKEASQAEYVIALGKSSLTDKLGLKPLELPKEAFLVKSFDRGIVIAGHDGSLIPNTYNNMDWGRYRINGTLNGTYDFIERMLGVRYYFPGLGIVAPKIKNLSLKPVSYYDEPIYRNRFNWGYSQINRNWPWKDVKKVNNFDLEWRMAMSTRFNDVCHSPNPHYLLATYPDKKNTIFFTDNKGYTYYNPATHIGNLMDITNPELAKLLVQSYKKFYDLNGKWDNSPWRQKGKGWYPPNSEYVLFGQADTFVRDLISEKNIHLFPESRRKSSDGMLSDLYVNFYCMIANEMKKEIPGKRLGVLAYHNYTLPPIVVKDIPDNIDFQVCMGRIVMAKNPLTRKIWTQTFKEWYDVLGKRQVTAWTYGAQQTAFTQAIQGRYMKDYINTVKPWLSRDGLFFDASGLRWQYYYSYYPVYRAMWNPDFDVDAALDEHWEKLYGPKAGAKLKEFYKILVDRWENVAIANCVSKKQRNSNATPEMLYSAYNIPTINKLEKLLKDAIDLTEKGSVERRRVEFFASPWQKDFVAAKAYCNLMIPVYEVRRLNDDDKITIDGKLDENIWKKAPSIPMQQANGHGGTLPSKPNGKIVWDAKGLYVAFTAQGKPVINKGDVWFGSDNIEIFLSPGTEKATYYQLAITPGNDFSDGYKVEKPMEAALTTKWDCPGLKRAVSVTDNSWTAELFIPFEGLHRTPTPKPYSIWFGNLVNNKLISKKNVAEYSAFSLTMGRNHNHALWGNFKFLGKGDEGSSAKKAPVSGSAKVGDITVEKVNRTYHQASKTYGKAEYFELRNKLNSYILYFQWIKQTAKRPGRVVIGIPEPVFWQGYVNRDFMKLNINGINSSSLEPQSISAFAEKDKAGVDALYNFDGVKMTLRFYMTEKSPLLMMEWIKDKSSAPIKKITLDMSTYPSYSLPVGGKPANRYFREIKTPARVIKGAAKGCTWRTLNPTDTYCMMYDTAFDYPATAKAQGPCYMAINWNGIKSGRCWFGKIYCMNFRFQLDPAAERWQFGLWEFKKRMSNQEFFDLFKANESSFMLPAAK